MAGNPSKPPVAGSGGPPKGAAAGKTGSSSLTAAEISYMDEAGAFPGGGVGPQGQSASVLVGSMPAMPATAGM